MAHGGGAAPFMLHFGDPDGAIDHMRRALQCLRRMIEEPNQQREAYGLFRGLTSWSLVACIAELPRECCEALALLLAEHGLTWADADKTVDAIGHPAIRKRGDTMRDAGAVFSSEMCGWAGRCASVSMSAKHTVSSVSVLCSLPSVEEAIDMSLTFDHHSFANTLVSYNNICKR